MSEAEESNPQTLTRETYNLEQYRKTPKLVLNNWKQDIAMVQTGFKNIKKQHAKLARNVQRLNKNLEEQSGHLQELENRFSELLISDHTKGRNIEEYDDANQATQEIEKEEGADINFVKLTKILQDQIGMTKLKFSQLQNHCERNKEKLENAIQMSKENIKAATKLRTKKCKSTTQELEDLKQKYQVELYIAENGKFESEELEIIKAASGRVCLELIVEISKKTLKPEPRKHLTKTGLLQSNVCCMPETSIKKSTNKEVDVIKSNDDLDFPEKKTDMKFSASSSLATYSPKKVTENDFFDCLEE